MIKMGRKKIYAFKTTVISFRVPENKKEEIHDRFSKILAEEYMIKIDDIATTKQNKKEKKVKSSDK